VSSVILATAERNPTWPKWSPDGRKLYYLCFEQTASGPAQAIVERELATGTERELLRRAGAGLGVPSLSPDGAQLGVQLWPKDTRDTVLVVLPVAGGEPREVLRVSAPATLRNVSWTPDGRLYASKFWPDSGRRESLLVPLTGGEPLRIEGPGSTFGLRFHPDGRRVAYVEGTSESEIWVLEGLDEALTLRP
jgi:dipeptidyl aminopeptidase/acylaminoacyl peptidase